MGHSFFVPVKLPATSGLLSSVNTPGPVFGGWVIHSVGGAAVVRMWDNASAASGTLLCAVDLTAPGTVGCFDHFQIDPLFVKNGIWVEYVSGTVEGSVYVA